MVQAMLSKLEVVCHTSTNLSGVKTETGHCDKCGSVLQLTIKVTDVNDNAPRFELPDYQAHNVDEDVPVGTSILQVLASDMDQGRNAEIDYSLDKDDFLIDGYGIIFSNKRLDADVNNTYVVTVRATDRGEPPLTGTATVRIYTENKNDEPPKFSQDVYTPNVDENAGPNTLVTTVVASDKDGDNIFFGFVGGGTVSGMFQIEERTGVIRLINGQIQLDKDKYELNVTARDDGACCKNGALTAHTSTALVVVFITDVNDNKPLFEECVTYAPQVEEGAPSGTSVIKVTACLPALLYIEDMWATVGRRNVKATDQDKGHNGQVRYSIVQQPNQKGTKFIIDEVTGEIKTNKLVNDPITPSQCKLVIVVNTSFQCKLNIFVNTSIQCKLFNDAITPSQCKLNIFVNTSIQCKLVKDAITPSQCKLVIVFDREGDDGRFVSVTVKATDRGNPPLEGVCSFKVEITDINDNPPLFDRQEYRENVKQDTPKGTNILRVSASDEDADNNGAIVYNLTAPYDVSDRDYFDINPDSGWVSLKKALDITDSGDRPRLTVCVQRDQYHLRAIALDKGTPQHRATVEVIIDVVDRANNPPIWDQPVYGPIFIKENLEVGRRVISIKARYVPCTVFPQNVHVCSRSGIPNNPTVFYTLMKGSTEQTNKRDTFYPSQRSENGFTWADIYVNYPLDYERIQQYNLTMRVEVGLHTIQYTAVQLTMRAKVSHH
ncbi:hmr-1 [Cordylochernes scorpioides]|uniref:Hmr-1 n=1 Tax=Cordylochernes scorpioides TaxID=51811 RepID=A0ABY6KFX4_9ARAC|nr:hmr-1 [Cordylochernes scorpioides]